MKELEEVAAAWSTVRATGGEAVLATVVQVSGSTYRRPGARMLLTSEGRLAGSVSGGCLEGDLLKKAGWHTRCGPALVTYDSTDEDEDVVWGFGLGCNGIVQVLLERVSPEAPGPLDLLDVVRRSRAPGVVATVIGGSEASALGQRFLLHPDGTQTETIADPNLVYQIEADARDVLASGLSCPRTYSLPDNGTATVFLEAIMPPLPLIIFGANHDALPLVRLAKELGWHVTVVDTRAAMPRPERFPGADAVLAGPIDTLPIGLMQSASSAAVIMTHNYPDDKRLLRRLLDSPLFYIGQLGPRVRTERLLAEISDDGFSITESHRQRLHGPVGLDLGADTPEQIALSTVAEIQAVHTGRTGGLLRERKSSLHPALPSSEPLRSVSGQLRERAVCTLPA